MDNLRLLREKKYLFGRYMLTNVSDTRFLRELTTAAAMQGNVSTPTY